MRTKEQILAEMERVKTMDMDEDTKAYVMDGLVKELKQKEGEKCTCTLNL